jgi:hypothetical protein
LRANPTYEYRQRVGTPLCDFLRAEQGRLRIHQAGREKHKLFRHRPVYLLKPVRIGSAYPINPSPLEQLCNRK